MGSRLATSHFHVNIAKWIGEADGIKALDRNREALKEGKCENVSRGSSVLDEMRRPRAEMKYVPT